MLDIALKTTGKASVGEISWSKRSISVINTNGDGTEIVSTFKTYMQLMPQLIN
jgi:hypothetical protein